MVILLLQILSATSQVVAGARYVVTAKIGLSDCKKSEQKLLETCELLSSPEPEICTIDVWDRPWLNKTVYKIKCGEKLYKFGDDEGSRKKREIIDKMGSDPEITTFKQFAVRYNKVYKDQDEFRFRLKVSKICIIIIILSCEMNYDQSRLQILIFVLCFYNSLILTLPLFC